MTSTCSGSWGSSRARRSPPSNRSSQKSSFSTRGRLSERCTSSLERARARGTPTSERTSNHPRPAQVLDAAITCLKVDGGPAGREGLLVGLDEQMDKTAGSLDALKTRMKKLMPKKEPLQRMAIVVRGEILALRGSKPDARR